MVRPMIVAALLAVALASCDKKSPSNVTYVEDDDAKMNAAMAKARATVKQFIAVVKSPKPGQTGVALKVPFKDGKHVEHMWVNTVRYDGKNFHGVLNNDPVQVKTVKIGDPVTVAPDKISDWMYVEGGKLVGGETLRALRADMPPGERAEFDRGLPFKIE